MSFAIIAGTAVAVGAINAYQGYEAGKKADKYNKQAMQLNQQQIDFAKQQYEDWKNIYGGIEQNLSNYYDNLSPQLIETQTLQSLQQSYQQQRNEMNQYFAQMGIESGVQADLMQELGMQKIRDEATAKVTAPMKAAEAKQSFLNIGLNQKGSAINGIQNAIGNRANLASSFANQETQLANQAYKNAGQTFGIVANSYIKSQMPIKANDGNPTIKGG